MTAPESATEPGPPRPGIRARGALAAGLLALLWPAPAPARQATSRPLVNKYCPVLREEPASPGFALHYQGRTVGFCCDKCLAKFKANPQRYARRLAAFQEAPPAAAGGAPPARPAQQHAARAQPPQHQHEHAAPRDRHRYQTGQQTRPGRLAAWLGNFHPPAVNFPIAMVIGAALAELLLVATRRSFFANAGRYCLCFGATSAVGAALLGWCFAGFHLAGDSRILATHRWLGTTTAAWMTVVLVLGERACRRQQAGRTAFRLALLLGVALVGATGFLGGSLVYGLDHYAW